MASTNKTTHYNLSQYIGTDKPTYLVDYNTDMSNIDTGIYGAKSLADANASSIGTLSNLETTVKSDLVSAINEEKAKTDLIGNLSNLTTTANQNLVVAINEVDANNDANTSAIGTLSNLETANKANLVGAINEIFSNIIPIATIMPYAGSTAPTKYLICDGSAISRTTYATLFNVIGTTYGDGNGSTTFNLPNLKGKVPVGLDSMQTEFNALGKNGGSKELQEHYHTIVDDPNKYVMYYYGDGSGNINGQVGGNQLLGGSDVEHTSTAGTGNSGNLQPYTTLNYIIKVS